MFTITFVIISLNTTLISLSKASSSSKLTVRTNFSENIRQMCPLFENLKISINNMMNYCVEKLLPCSCGCSSSESVLRGSSFTLSPSISASGSIGLSTMESTKASLRPTSNKVNLYEISSPFFHCLPSLDRKLTSLTVQMQHFECVQEYCSPTRSILPLQRNANDDDVIQGDRRIIRHHTS